MTAQYWMTTTLVLAGAVHAETAPPDLWMAQADRVLELRRVGPDALGMATGELQRERVVKGAPVCATAVHEAVQTLADGNRIVRAQRTELCRDGEGRTRREILRDGGARTIYLHDPVTRESWVLHPETQTARRLGAGAAAEGPPEAMLERLRENAGRWREWAAEAAQQARKEADAAAKEAREARAAHTEALKAARAAGRGEPAVVVNEEVVVREGGGEPQRHREVRVIRLNDMAPLPPLPPMAPMSPLTPMTPMGFPLLGMGGLPRDGGVTTALPPRDIEGVRVNGERTTWTIEAGKIGNEKPIVISREVWKSPELMLTVLSKDSDPRSGEVNYRLEKIRRGEPDAALMKVPADYKKEAPRRLAVPPVPPVPSVPLAPKPPAPQPPAKG